MPKFYQKKEYKMVEKRKRPASMVKQKKIKLDTPQALPEVDNTRKEINKVYSKLLAKDCRDRVKFVQKALGLIGEDLLGASKKHDLCRVIQACLKYGNEQQKHFIYENLKPYFSEVASGKYSYFLAKKLLKFEDKESLLAEVLTNARSMFCTIYGIRFLDLLYTEGKHKSKLLQSIFNSNTEFDSLETISPESIQELKSSVPIKKIMKKGLIDYPLIIHIVYIYLSICTFEEKQEILCSLYDHFESLIKTRYGAILAIQSLAISDTKQRKIILKVSASLVFYIYDPESYAYLYFTKLIQVIDDTKRVKKMIILPINQNMSQLVLSTNGAKFLMSLFPYEFSSGVSSDNEIQALEENLNTTSKKDVKTKKKEIFEAVSQMLAKEIEKNFDQIINNPRLSGLIIGTALSVIHGDLKSQEFVNKCAESCGNWEIMNHNVGQRVLKKILEFEAEAEGQTFTKTFIKAIAAKQDYLEKLIKCRGV